MPELKWLRLLMNHIPDEYKHLVRYYGDYLKTYLLTSTPMSSVLLLAKS